MSEPLKHMVYRVVAPSDKKGSLSWYFDLFIMALILLNALAIVLESVEELRAAYAPYFIVFDVFSVAVFTVEYVMRLWTAHLIPGYAKAPKGNLRWAFTPMAIIDLLAFLPFYLPLFGLDLRFLRILRMFRIFRLLKIVRYVEALSFIERVFRKKKGELVISLIFLAFILLIASSLMYYVEKDAQDAGFKSIPEALWWGVATLTTVGYGDIYPITPLGRLLGGIIAVLAIALFALPSGILASGFAAEMQRRKSDAEEGQRCPTCGQLWQSKQDSEHEAHGE